MFLLSSIRRTDFMLKIGSIIVSTKIHIWKPILFLNYTYLDWSVMPNQPAMFTELWTGWFSRWGSGKFVRPAQDVAYAAARFIAKGGTYVAYYMWHGGTNFGRWGSHWKTTSYDYDAPLNEYGYPTVKYFHLMELHLVLNEFAGIISEADPVYFKLGPSTVSRPTISCML
jgi:hypothetical protein